MPKPPDVILTGVPRGGTTLAAAMIDGLPDTVCLNEPGWHNAKMASTPEAFARFIASDFAQLRQRLLRGEAVPDRRSAVGSAVTNYYAVNQGGQMENRFDVVPFTRAGLSGNFTFTIKHNGPYLAVLPQLAAMQRFTVIAIVRHPLEVIASWRRLSLPISRGEMPNATPFWPEMARIVATEQDLLVRQVKMYDEMCRRILSLKGSIHILPYEELIKKPQTLAQYLGSNHSVTHDLVDKPARKVNEAQQQSIAQALKDHTMYYREFYPD